MLNKWSVRGSGIVGKPTLLSYKPFYNGSKAGCHNVFLTFIRVRFFECPPGQKYWGRAAGRQDFFIKKLE